MNITELFLQRAKTPSDINEHMPVLALLAAAYPHITEFGVRTGNSTISFLAGFSMSGRRGSVLASYDINQHSVPSVPLLGIDWRFTQADTAKLASIEDTNVLFVDTLHTYAQVKAELKHAKSVTNFIVFHDTVLFGENGENGEPGIQGAIGEFLANNPEWHVFTHYENNNGLLILRRGAVT